MNILSNVCKTCMRVSAPEENVVDDVGDADGNWLANVKRHSLAGNVAALGQGMEMVDQGTHFQLINGNEAMVICLSTTKTNTNLLLHQRSAKAKVAEHVQGEATLLAP